MHEAKIQNWTVKIAKTSRMEMLSGMRERIERTKSDNKPIGQNKNNLVSEEEQNKAKQNMQRQLITTSSYWFSASFQAMLAFKTLFLL